MCSGGVEISVEDKICAMAVFGGGFVDSCWDDHMICDLLAVLEEDLVGDSYQLIDFAECDFD